MFNIKERLYFMDVNKCLEKISQTINELEKLYPSLMKNDSLSLSQDNLLEAMAFVSKINGLESTLDAEFIKENKLTTLFDMINIDKIKIEAAHYDDQNLFYDYIGIIYPQLKFRFNLIKKKYSLNAETLNKLIITKEYYQYLTNLLKDYLEMKIDNKLSKEIEEILQIIHLYRVYDGGDRVCLGSMINYADSLTNEEERGRIVIDSHANLRFKKLALKTFFPCLNAKVNDVVFIDYSLTYYVKILKIQNEEEKVTLH